MLRRPSLLMWISILTVFALVGCSNTGFQRAAKASSGIRDTRAEIVSAKAQVQATVGSLDALMAKQKDLPALYSTFSDDVSNLESDAAAVTKRAQDMQSKGDDYFESWGSQLETFDSKEMKERSEKRRSELMETFKTTRTSMTEAKEAFDPFMKSLNDMVKYLAADLTPASIDSISDVADGAKKSSETVLEKADAMLEALDELEKQLAPTAEEDEETTEKPEETEEPEKTD